jgi:ubiquinone/menaquinone biosynthesis C-methylase UbiE
MQPAHDPTTDYKMVVRDGYDRCARAYAAARTDKVHPLLSAVIKDLPVGAQVLDVGCGAGVPVCRELASRAAVIGVDLSPQMIALARQNVPTARFIEADIRVVEFPATSFDAVTAFYSIFHIAKQDHAEVFRRIYRWLKPGGVLLCTLSCEDEEPYTEDDFFGVTMYWSNYGIAQYAPMLNELGFVLQKSTMIRSGFNIQQEADAEAHPLILARKSQET